MQANSKSASIWLSLEDGLAEDGDGGGPVKDSSPAVVEEEVELGFSSPGLRSVFLEFSIERDEHRELRGK